MLGFMQKDLAIILASIVAGGIYMACTPDVVDSHAQGGGGIAHSCSTSCSAFCGCHTSCTTAGCDDFTCGTSSTDACGTTTTITTTTTTVTPVTGAGGSLPSP